MMVITVTTTEPFTGNTKLKELTKTPILWVWVGLKAYQCWCLFAVIKNSLYHPTRNPLINDRHIRL
jgi:hypothetical protein